MRTIKFRGQRADTKEWVYGYYVITPTIQHRIYWKPFDDATSNTYHIVIPETVGQFTGHTDRNGKEIYEGDIIEFDRKEWSGDDNIHTVEWNDYNAEWSWGGGCTGDMEWRTVIGNIYQHDYLLPQK